MKQRHPTGAADESAILSVELRYEHDVVLARQRARQLAGLLGFDLQDQTRLATALSEIARNAFQYAGGGKVQFALSVQGDPELLIRVQDNGPGIQDVQRILDGRYQSRTGMGLGLIGAKRLMDRFEIQSTPGQGTVVMMARRLPAKTVVTPEFRVRLVDELSRLTPQDPFEEVQRQNQELLQALEQLRQQRAELEQLNHELEDTNRGVVALYAELDERADYLRRASELKSRFLSNMTHEFRTPLNSILSLSRLLNDQMDGPLTPEQQKQVSFIQRAADDLSELVNDLLDLAKVEAGKVVIRPQPFEVGNLFGALRGMLRPLLSANSAVNLVFEEPVGIPTLHTDEAKVSQILRNFISNALKFTAHGEVRVWAQWDAEHEMVRFAVRDTGIGIAPEHQQRVFQEFGQVENPMQKTVKGTGLGLPLSKKLAELMGGELTLESTPGVGSTFCATIPARYTGPAEVAFAPDVTKQLDPNRRPILVVEDNKETLFVYEKYLKNTGYQAIPARSLAEARAALKQFRPTAIILDILLEGESTWTFLSEVKGAEATRGVPVYVVTVVENQLKAKALGADGYHVKPLNRAWLLAQLDNIGLEDRRKLLVVDDDEISRYLLLGLLVDTRYSVIEASNGSDGLRLAGSEKPAAIFLDLNMPDMSGFEVLSRLKNDPATAAIPVIIYSSRRLSDAERSELGPKVAAIVSKESPSREVALKQIRQALETAGLGAAATPEVEQQHV